VETAGDPEFQRAGSKSTRLSNCSPKTISCWITSDKLVESLPFNDSFRVLERWRQGRRGHQLLEHSFAKIVSVSFFLNFHENSSFNPVE
jgi:hypothetical protein